jgi:hypothetical protein
VSGDTGRPTLIYASRCPLCRFLSRTIVLMSLGTVVREPLDQAEAERFYYVEHPQARGKPALFDRGKVFYGWAVVPATFVALCRTWFQRLAMLTRRQHS